MNKKLYITSWILFIINICFVCIYTFHYHLTNVSSPNVGIFYWLILTLIVFRLIFLFRKKEHINYDKVYNLLFIAANVFMLFVFLRGVTDPYITFNYNGYNEQSESIILYVGNNLLYMNIMITALLLYPLTLTKQKNSQIDKKKKTS